MPRLIDGLPRGIGPLSLKKGVAIAGLRREGKAGAPSAFTMLTTEPSPDVEPFHNRQVVVMRPEDWAHWIYLTKPQAELLRPLPEGSLEAETVRGGSD